MTALLDTSMVVRYLMRDQPQLAEASARVIDIEEGLLISDVVIVEVAHVLTSNYRVARERVVDSLMEFLQKENIETLHLPKDLVLMALRLCRPSRRVSFPDAFIWTAARAEDLPVYTLDRRFPAEGISVLSPQ